MFVPAVWFDVKFTSMAFGAGLAALLIAEILRLGLAPPFGSSIHKYMSSFIDEKDQGQIITSHLYLFQQRVYHTYNIIHTHDEWTPS